MPTLTYGSAFSGIGGTDLGFDRAGMKCLWQIEKDPYALAVLKKHWPEVRRESDLRAVIAKNKRERPISVGARLERPDIIVAGFPCQDISVAGKQAGIHGARSGLFFVLMRLVRLVRPRILVLENVPALLSRANFEAVVQELAASGFHPEWDCIPASAVGAPHIRDRVFIVANAVSDELRVEPGRRSGQDWARASEPRHDGAEGSLADEDSPGLTRSRLSAIADRKDQVDLGRRREDVAHAGSVVGSRRSLHAGQGPRGRESDGGGLGENLADPDRCGLAEHQELDSEQEANSSDWNSCRQHTHRRGDEVADSDEPRLAQRQGEPGDDGAEFAATVGADWWVTEPDVGRVAHGVPSRVDRLRCLGNAVVPQVAELLGRAIVAAVEGGWPEEQIR